MPRPRLAPLTRGALALSPMMIALAAACSSTPEAVPDPGLDAGALPTCSDGVQNGDETGVDCGGACAACVVTPVKTCGAGTPALCADGAECARDAECASDYCASGRCGPPGADAHADGRKNAGETDVDCGGKSGKLCDPGKKCASVDDCVSSCTSGVCATPSDADGKKNNGETDVDCGGPNAKKCGVGKVCAAGGDCGLGYCPAGKCEAPTSTDNVKNGLETDIDCGGGAMTYDGVTVPAAPKCALTKTCGADGDCERTVCAANKKCVEAPSCRPTRGGYTCGTGETGAAPNHESCCKSLPVAGLTMNVGGVDKQVYLDKYEITAGRIRAWVAAIKAQYGGVPNVQAWVKARMATDPILAAMYPTDRADYLPKMSTGQLATFPLAGGGTTMLDLGLEDQLGPTSYYRGVQIGGTSGCYLGANAYGHRTYWYDQAQSTYFTEVFRGDAAKDILDEKSMNCMTPIMFAAFCAWDGGYLQSQAAISTAYGPATWPWGATPDVRDNVAKIANYNNGTGSFSPANPPRYLFPAVNYATFADDFSPIIAAPGRFPGDVASQSRPGMESWMDLGGNMIEWSQANANWYGWTGSSFEGHYYPRRWTSNVYYLDKYGKGGARCMRLQ